MEGGKVHKSEADILDYVHRYYQELYRNGPEVELNQIGKEFCLQSVPLVVTEEMNELLCTPFDALEVERAMREVPKHKAPGHDAIPRSCFTKCGTW